MDDFTIKRNDVGSFHVQLSISLQMELGEYVEPIPGVPDTYESEERVYLVTPEELQHWCTKARRYAGKYLGSVHDDLALEHLKATYRDVHRIITHEEPIPEISTSRYEADEDLMFLYGRLHVLHKFIFEAREALREEGK